MKLYIFRHGETDANLHNIVQGAKDLTPLNATGLIQAAKLRDELAPLQLPIIYSSPLSRARQTAEIVASANQTPVKIVDGLHEQDFGIAEGLYESEVGHRWKKEFLANMDVTDEAGADLKIPEGESRREALERFKSAIAAIKADNPYEIAGVAAHGTVMRDFYYDLYQKPYIFKNCEYFVLEV